MNLVLDQMIKNVTQNKNGTKMNVDQYVKNHYSEMCTKKTIYCFPLYVLSSVVNIEIFIQKRT